MWRMIPGGTPLHADAGLSSGSGDTSANSPDGSTSDCDNGNAWVACW